MRAQLDCHNPDLPGTGIFDIKTRAAVPIRYDLENYKVILDYIIHTRLMIVTFSSRITWITKSALCKATGRALRKSIMISSAQLFSNTGTNVSQLDVRFSCYGRL